VTDTTPKKPGEEKVTKIVRLSVGKIYIFYFYSSIVGRINYEDII